MLNNYPEDYIIKVKPALDSRPSQRVAVDLHEANLTPLQGTEAQIRYAEDIRIYKIRTYWMVALPPQVQLQVAWDKLQEEVNKYDQAKWWIDNKSTSDLAPLVTTTKYLREIVK